MVCVMHAALRIPGACPDEVAWEMNSLFPDDATGLFGDPLMAEGLYPPERFDHPNLRRLPASFSVERADAALGLLIAKGCAGLRQDLRSTPAALRAAIETMRFPEREASCLRWLLPGLRAEMFRRLASASGITLHHLVRGLWAFWGSGSIAYAPWLNQWARNPDKPLPDHGYAGGSRTHYQNLWQRVCREGGEVLRVASEAEVPDAVARAERRGVEVVLVDESLPEQTNRAFAFTAHPRG